jgi:hypothetical protein
VVSASDSDVSTVCAVTMRGSAFCHDAVVAPCLSDVASAAINPATRARMATDTAAPRSRTGVVRRADRIRTPAWRVTRIGEAVTVT